MGIESLAVIGVVAMLSGPGEAPEVAEPSPPLAATASMPVVAERPPKFEAPTRPVSTPHPRRARWLGLGMASVGVAGFASTYSLQRRDLRGQSICVRSSDPLVCLDNSSAGAAALRATGMLTLIGGGLAAGAMFGRTRAMIDQDRGRPKPETRRTLAWLGSTLMVGSGYAIMLTAIVTNAEKKCRADPVCGPKLRRTGYSAMNVSTVGVALGAAFCAYVVAERRGWDKMQHLSVSPTLTRQGAALSLSGVF